MDQGRTNCRVGSQRKSLSLCVAVCEPICLLLTCMMSCEQGTCEPGPSSLWLTLAISLVHSGSLLLSLIHSCFRWLTLALSLWFTLAHSSSLWLSLAYSGSLSGAHQLKRSFTAIAKVHLPWYRRCKVVFKWRFLETTIILNQSKIKSISFQCNGFDINSVKRLNLL